VKIAIEVLSAITSPVFSELVIVLWTDNHITRFPWNPVLFQTLRTMREVRPFELVFLLDMNSPHLRHGEARRNVVEALRKFTKALDSVIAKGLLDFLDSPPTIRLTGPRYYGWDRSFPHFD